MSKICKRTSSSIEATAGSLGIRDASGVWDVGCHWRFTKGCCDTWKSCFVPRPTLPSAFGSHRLFCYRAPIPIQNQMMFLVPGRPNQYGTAVRWIWRVNDQSVEPGLSVITGDHRCCVNLSQEFLWPNNPSISDEWWTISKYSLEFSSWYASWLQWCWPLASWV